MSLKDLMYQDRVNRDYGVTIPYQDPQPPTPQPPAMPAIQPLPAIEDFLPEFEVREPECVEPTVTQTMGQPALEIWALESARIREGKTIPTIHRHSNAVLREKHLHDVRCPSCGLEFAAEVES